MSPRIGHTSEDRWPWPVPFGWFALAWGSDLAQGEVHPVHAFGEDLVIWRDAAGAAHVHDAYCPHLGAHLGHGGTVDGACLVCPFHGWSFDENGDNVDVPYSERTNRRARLRTWPVVERNGLVMAWWHPHDVAPQWDVPIVPEFVTDADGANAFSSPVTRRFEVAAPWQEMAENGVDAAHFRYVHRTAEVPVIESYETEGHRASMRSKQFFVTPRGTVAGRIDTDTYGPGCSVVRFSGIVDTVLLGCTTPIERDRCELRFTFAVRRLADESATSLVGQAFVDEISRQVAEDIVIWENKRFLALPALADADGPIMDFRRWAAQFYA